MTKRAHLTPHERQTMLEKQEGRCASCDGPIGPQEDGTSIPFIKEHTRPVAQGNDQKPDCLLCVPCAKVKTYGTKATTAGSDIHGIAKAKRIAKGGKKIKNPFPKRPSGSKHQWPKRRFGG